MPGLDRTGPQGQGSRTGRGLGRCNPNNKGPSENTEQDIFPRGRGLGRKLRQQIRGGMGRNRGNS